MIECRMIELKRFHPKGHWPIPFLLVKASLSETRAFQTKNIGGEILFFWFHCSLCNGQSNTLTKDTTTYSCIVWKQCVFLSYTSDIAHLRHMLPCFFVSHLNMKICTFTLASGYLEEMRWYKIEKTITYRIVVATDDFIGLEMEKREDVT